MAHDLNWVSTRCKQTLTKLVYATTSTRAVLSLIAHKLPGHSHHSRMSDLDPDLEFDHVVHKYKCTYLKLSLPINMTFNENLSERRQMD